MHNFKRESYSGLNTWMYFISKDLVSFIPVTIISLSFTAGIFLASPKGNFGAYLIISMLTIMASFPTGYIISYFFEPHTGMYILKKDPNHH